MISSDTIQKIRSSTCAILYMPIKHEDAFPNAKAGDAAPLPNDHTTQVFATGFLIRDDLVLTNRHVVAEILRDRQEKGHHEHWYVRFTYPRDQSSWAETTKRIKRLLVFGDPAGDGGLDVGLLSFYRDPGELRQCQSVEFGELESIAVGTDIAICGFPYGNKLLVNAPLGVLRFGPVVHQGIISAVSPFDSVDQRSITTFLTDLNSAGGMSGSPVFLPDSGRVIGLHYAGADGTLGWALPLDLRRVEGWISFYDHTINDPLGLYALHIRPGGDIVDPQSVHLCTV